MCANHLCDWWVGEASPAVAAAAEAPGQHTERALPPCCPTAGRRPALLSAVMLRQNPHNVAEWHKRVKLFTGDPTKQVRTELFVCVCMGLGCFGVKLVPKLSARMRIGHICHRHCPIVFE